jgi:predicted nucleotidyltransferase
MVAPHPRFDERQLRAFCQKWRIGELALFGSILRDDFGEGSDVDVLFAMLPGAEYDWDGYWAMKCELEAIYGRPVDLVDRKTLEASPNWVRRRHILSTSRTVYAA